MTRVPMVLTKGLTGWSTNAATIGRTRVHLNDAALGVGIAIPANACTEAICAFLVQGGRRGAG